MKQSFPDKNAQQEDREEAPGVQAGNYEKDPELDLAMVGDDSTLPESKPL